MRNKNNVRGFTVLELMVTIAVLGIIVAMAVPSYQKMVAKSNIRTAAQSLTEAINEARMEAISQKKVVTLKANEDAKRKCVEGTSWRNGWVITNSSKNGVREWQTDSCHTEVLITPDGQMSLEFLRNGFVTNDKGEANAISFCVSDERVSDYAHQVSLRQNGLMTRKEITNDTCS